MGHMMPLGTGANGSLALSRTLQAAAGLGWLPPVGSHRSVQFAAPPEPPVTLMSRDTFAGAAGAAGELAGAGAAPQAAATAAPTAALTQQPAPGPPPNTCCV